jgi:hypothetical protein
MSDDARERVGFTPRSVPVPPRALWYQPVILAVAFGLVATGAWNLARPHGTLTGPAEGGASSITVPAAVPAPGVPDPVRQDPRDANPG